MGLFGELQDRVGRSHAFMISCRRAGSQDARGGSPARNVAPTDAAFCALRPCAPALFENRGRPSHSVHFPLVHGRFSVHIVQLGPQCVGSVFVL